MKLFTFVFLAAATFATGSPYPPQGDLTVAETSIPGSYSLIWPGVQGRLYIIQVSSDLDTWTTVPGIIKLGDGGEVIFPFSVDGPRLYLRIRYTLIANYTLGNTGDADGDGLANLFEVQNGLDLFVFSDADADGILDHLDAYPDDPSAWQAPAASPADNLPPAVALITPTSASLLP